MNFLGKNIRYLRKHSSKTQSEIASLIKKGQTTIGNWENGISEPNVEELLILSNFFDIPLDVLIKVDLTEAASGQSVSKVGNLVAYDHSSDDGSYVKEDRMNYVLQEIRSLREELDKLNERISQ